MALTAEQEAREAREQAIADALFAHGRRRFVETCVHTRTVPTTFQTCFGPQVSVCIDCGKVV